MKINTQLYNAKFYEGVDKTAYDSASAVLPSLLTVLPEIHSAVDFVCGIGTWLSVLHTLGVEEIKGVDGKWVDRSSQKIPQECFEPVELDKDISLNKKYDLAISLEIAEHLPEQSAKTFVEALTKASDVVLFSAAIPFQGGTNHVNEQWPDYWYSLFKSYGFIAVDYIRQVIWEKIEVSFWYRQNMILFVKAEKLPAIKVAGGICVS